MEVAVGEGDVGVGICVGVGVAVDTGGAVVVGAVGDGFAGWGEEGVGEGVGAGGVYPGTH